MCTAVRTATRHPTQEVPHDKDGRWKIPFNLAAPVYRVRSVIRNGRDTSSIRHSRIGPEPSTNGPSSGRRHAGRNGFKSMSSSDSSSDLSFPSHVDTVCLTGSPLAVQLNAHSVIGRETTVLQRSNRPCCRVVAEVQPAVLQGSCSGPTGRGWASWRWRGSERAVASRCELRRGH